MIARFLKGFSLFIGPIGLICLIGLIVLTTGCQEQPVVKGSVWQDATMQSIYDLQNRRAGEGLLPYLKDDNPQYRRAAALAFASVQDAVGVTPLYQLFTDPEEPVRIAAAYALGQVKDKQAEPLLIQAFEKESSPQVKQFILEAIGKCGTAEKGLTFLTGLKLKPQDKQVLIGQAWGIYRFGLRDIVSAESTARAVALLDRQMPGKARFIAANYLARTRNLDLLQYAPLLLEAYQNDPDVFVRMNLAAAMENAKTPDVLEHLKKILQEKIDYRIRVNALRALRGFDRVGSIRESLLEALKDNNVNISIAAAEFLQANGDAGDAELYFETAKGIPHWRSRTTLYAAALKMANHKNNELSEKVIDTILKTYKESQNNYEKANLLKALAAAPSQFQFVRQEAFANTGNVIGTYALDTLVGMSRFIKDDSKQLAQFAETFKRAVETLDSAKTAIAAAILRDPDMPFKQLITDTAFISQAMKKLQLPRDLEAHRELKQTLAYLTGQTVEENTPTKNSEIDWKSVNGYPRDLKIIITTGKGDIHIRLLMEQSPGSVVNFISLFQSGFYKNSHIHRVVPNFVAQDGCPRGDGWGGPVHTIGSELGPLYYEEGSVGMASAGKDTEGSQWFITHSPTPHLDGRYTIFGKVVSGMEVVHKLEVGDPILGFKITP